MQSINHGKIKRVEWPWNDLRIIHHQLDKMGNINSSSHDNGMVNNEIVTITVTWSIVRDLRYFMSENLQGKQRKYKIRMNSTIRSFEHLAFRHV